MTNAKSGGPLVWLRAFGVTAVGPIGEDAVTGLGAKALGLLTFLAVNSPTPVTRDAIVDLLWERVEPSQGKGSLRQELRSFKRNLGDDLFDAMFEVSDNHIGLRAGVVSFDVAQLDRAANSEDPDEIAAIMSLYRDDFLAGNTARAEPFQDWARERATYYRDLAIAAVVRLAFMDLEAGRYERCQQAADWVIGVDPLHEQAQEALVRCHLATGRRGQARSAYEIFRSRMIREIGAEPEATLAALVAPDAEVRVKPRMPSQTPPPVEKKNPVIAVLNVSRDRGGDQDYLAGGVVEELVANLSRSSWLRVMALGSPMSPRDLNVETAQRDLRGNADYVLRVNVQIAGDRASIVSTLNRVADNATLFSDSMQSPANDILALQHATAVRIASIFEEKTLDDQGEMLRDMDFSGPEDMDHWRLLMRARWLFWRTSRRSNEEAQRLLGQAIALSPDDPPTLCLAAFSHMLNGWCDWTEDVLGSFTMARELAGRAVKAAPNSPWAQFTLGTASSTIGRLTEAKTRVERALSLAPTFVSATGDLARISTFMGDTLRGSELADEAMELSPYDPHYGLFVRTKSIGKYLDGDLAAALELIDYALIVRPGWFQNHYLKAAILSEMGDSAGARASFEEGAGMIGAYSDDAFIAGHPFGKDSDLARFATALNQVGGRFLN